MHIYIHTYTPLLLTPTVTMGSARVLIGVCVLMVAGAMIGLSYHAEVNDVIQRGIQAYHVAGSNEPIHLVNYQAHLHKVSV